MFKKLEICQINFPFDNFLKVTVIPDSNIKIHLQESIFYFYRDVSKIITFS